MPDHGTTDDHCLEVIVVRGKAAEIEELANTLIGTKGVKHGQLTLTSSGPSCLCEGLPATSPAAWALAGRWDPKFFGIFEIQNSPTERNTYLRFVLPPC
jgi:hypothetical protein